METSGSLALAVALAACAIGCTDPDPQAPVPCSGLLTAAREAQCRADGEDPRCAFGVEYVMTAPVAGIACGDSFLDTGIVDCDASGEAWCWCEPGTGWRCVDQICTYWSCD